MVLRDGGIEIWNMDVPLYDMQQWFNCLSIGIDVFIDLESYPQCYPELIVYCNEPLVKWQISLILVCPTYKGQGIIITISGASSHGKLIGHIKCMQESIRGNHQWHRWCPFTASPTSVIANAIFWLNELRYRLRFTINHCTSINGNNTLRSPPITCISHRKAACSTIQPLWLNKMSVIASAIFWLNELRYRLRYTINQLMQPFWMGR